MYDTARNLWHKEDGQELMALSRYGGAMMLLRRDGTLVDTSGTYGTEGDAGGMERRDGRSGPVYAGA